MLASSKASRGAILIQRRLFHLIVGSAIPLLALVAPRPYILAVTAGGVAFSILLELLRMRLQTLNRWLVTQLRLLLKEEESARLMGSTYLILAVLICFLLFQTDVAITALLFNTVGDPLAALAGARFGRRRIFQKSLEGSVTMLVAGLLVAGAMAAFRGLPYVLLLAGALIAAVIEALPLPADDNLTVPIGSGAGMSLLMQFCSV